MLAGDPEITCVSLEAACYLGSWGHRIIYPLSISDRPTLETFDICFQPQNFIGMTHYFLCENGDHLSNP